MARVKALPDEAKENKVRAAQERDLMKEQRRKIHIALEDIDFVWDADEVSVFRKLWNQGASIYELEEELGRDQDDIAMLIMDQSRRGKIQRRPMGLGA